MTQEYSAKYIITWLILHLIDLAGIITSLAELNIWGILACLALLIILIFVYHSHTVDLVRLGGRFICYYYYKVTKYNKQEWHAARKQYTYTFRDREHITNRKKIAVISRVPRLVAIDDKFSFSKEVKYVQYTLGSVSKKWTIRQLDDDRNYHFVQLKLDGHIKKNQTRNVAYTISVSDPQHETMPIYGATISQITKELELTVCIPPELNPKHIYFRVYPDSIEQDYAYQEKLEYSQEDHCIKKLVQYPCLYRRYMIEWDW